MNFNCRGDTTENEFLWLFEMLSRSGCAKKQTAAGTYINGRFVTAVNFCDYVGSSCPRMAVPSGTNYHLCKSQHAEAELAKLITETARLRTNHLLKSDGIAWLVGHYWACEPCAAALKAIGVKELRIREERI